jgi:hypothetical protein
LLAALGEHFQLRGNEIRPVQRADLNEDGGREAFQISGVRSGDDYTLRDVARK